MKKITTKKRAVIIGLLSLGLVCTAASGALYNVAAENAAPSFAIKQTASIRTSEPTGIRFETTIAKTEYNALKAKDAKYGTLVQSYALYEANGNVLEKGQAEAVDIPADNWKILSADDPETSDVDESTHNQYNAVLVGEKDPETGAYAGLPEEFYGVKLIARSYVTYTGDNGEVTEYGENVAIRSIADVAKAAILDTTRTYEPAEYAYFHDITDYVANQNALDEVTVNTVATEVNGTVTLGTSYGEVKAVYVLDGNDGEIASENWSYAEGALTFTEDYLKSLPYGEYTLKLFTDNAVLSLPTTIYGESTLGYESLLGFDNSKTVKNVKNSATTSTVAWLDEYQGAKGVMKINNNGEGADDSTGYIFVTDYSVAELAAMDWDYIEYKVFVESASESVWSYCSWNGDKGLGVIPVGSWYTIRLQKADLTTLFNDKINDFYGIFNKSGDGFKAFWGYGLNGSNVYFDYLTFGTYDVVENFDDPTTVSSVVNTSNVTWLKTFNGANGVLECASTPTTFKVKATVDALKALEPWKTLSVRMYIENLETSSTSKPDPITANWYFNMGTGSAPRGTWVRLNITYDNVVAQFNTIDQFYEAFISNSGAVFTSFWNMNGEKIYIDWIDFITEDEVTNVLSFNNEYETKAIITGTNMTWLESSTENLYATDKNNGNVPNRENITKYGVASYICSTASYSGLTIALYGQELDIALEDWDQLEVVVRIARPAESYGHTGYAGRYETDGYFTSVWLNDKDVGNIAGWSTLTLTKEQLAGSNTIESVWNNMIGTGGVKLFWCYTIYEQLGWNIQVDSISFVKNS